MRRDRRVQLAALVITLGCLVAIASLQPVIRDERDSLEIAVDSERNAQLPPDLAVLNAALGGFRSWIINFMWLRATKLQEEHRLYEAEQLSRWITQLSPHFDRVWTFQAWNLAFNISQQADTDADRWRWVTAGIDLLRRDGLEINPLSKQIHRELAWFFWFKIGDVFDESYRYYRRALADEWQENLGTPAGESTAVNLEQLRADGFRPIAIAPRYPEELAQLDPSFDVAIEALSDLEEGLDRSLLIEMTSGELDEPPTMRAEALQRIRDDLRVAGRFDEFVSFLRARVLREQYRMDPNLMLDMMEVLGPFDWRHEASHAAYWVVEGALRWAKQQREVRFLASDPDYRIVMDQPFLLMSLKKLAFESGRIDRDPATGRYARSPEPRFIRAYEDARFTNATDNARDLFQRDLEAATTTSYFFGDDRLVRRYFERLQVDFGVDTDLETFVEGQLRAEVERNVEAGMDRFSALQSLCVNVFTRGYAIGREDVALRFRDAAQRLLSSYAVSDPSLPSFDELFETTLFGYLCSSPVTATVAEKSRVWRAMPPETRAHLLPKQLPAGTLEEYLKALARSTGEEVEVLFPRN
ncbi:MAG: hypothetical protein KDC38_12330 [Planctomycetes bacterium]|nr:hypothetical protein [Planctomycetota bacterium]